MSFIAHAPIGFRIETLLGMQQPGGPEVYTVSYIIGIIFAILFYFGVLKIADKRKEHILSLDNW